MSRDEFEFEWPAPDASTSASPSADPPPPSTPRVPDTPLPPPPPPAPVHFDPTPRSLPRSDSARLPAVAIFALIVVGVGVLAYSWLSRAPQDLTTGLPQPAPAFDAPRPAPVERQPDPPAPSSARSLIIPAPDAGFRDVEVPAVAPAFEAAPRGSLDCRTGSGALWCVRVDPVPPTAELPTHDGAPLEMRIVDQHGVSWRPVSTTTTGMVLRDDGRNATEWPWTSYDVDSWFEKDLFVLPDGRRPTWVAYGTFGGHFGVSDDVANVWLAPFHEVLDVEAGGAGFTGWTGPYRWPTSPVNGYVTFGPLFGPESYDELLAPWALTIGDASAACPSGQPDCVLTLTFLSAAPEPLDVGLELPTGEVVTTTVPAPEPGQVAVAHHVRLDLPRSALDGVRPSIRFLVADQDLPPVGISLTPTSPLR